MGRSCLAIEQFVSALRIRAFVNVSTYQKAYRNLFYYRIGRHMSFFIKWLLPAEESLHICCPSIGVGAHLEHSYSTYLNADLIGDDFMCLHLVTLGKDGGRPTIGSNVKIYIGAVIFGGVMIGNNVNVGAGTVINKDVPDNCTVVGNSACIVRKNGYKVNITLSNLK
jgi:serine O-acetyltransferase